MSAPPEDGGGGPAGPGDLSDDDEAPSVPQVPSLEAEDGSNGRRFRGVRLWPNNSVRSRSRLILGSWSMNMRQKYQVITCAPTRRSSVVKASRSSRSSNVLPSSRRSVTLCGRFITSNCQAIDNTSNGLWSNGVGTSRALNHLRDVKQIGRKHTIARQ